MIRHIVLFKLKENASEETIQKCYSEIKNLKEKISGIEKISCGGNNSPEKKNQNYTEGFVIDFKDNPSRDNYLIHPAHLEIIEKNIAPIIEDVLVYDLEE